jgi:hypothetical protein
VEWTLSGRPHCGIASPAGPSGQGAVTGTRVFMERRTWPRSSAVGKKGISGARVLPGWYARIIDLSSGGALIETECRLLPGTQVELQLAGRGALRRVRGRVIRSHVAVLDRHQGIRYRGALMFDGELVLDAGVSEQGG